METLQAWQCVGCGRLEAPQTCLGVCRDRKVDLVYASQVEPMRALLLELALTTPREGGWEATYRAMQARARAVLASQR